MLLHFGMLFYNSYNVSFNDLSNFCIVVLDFDNFMKVTPEDVRKLALPPESIHKTPSGDTFVKSNLQKVSVKCAI